MKQQGFTLIEVIVVMAIVAILAGIMVPFAFKALESSEIDATNERMRVLKIAMVGDSALIQNGVRTDYGYVGDFGQLPLNLDYLIMNIDSDSHWNGPYLRYVGSNSEQDSYKKDAWHREITYRITDTDSDRRAAAVITSYGSDGKIGSSPGMRTSEDIVLNIDKADVITPTNTVQGDINIDFTAAPQDVLLYSGKITVKYLDGTGVWAQKDCCIPVSVSGSSGGTKVNYPGYSFSCSADRNLPVGSLKVQAFLYSDGSCAALKKAGEEIILIANGKSSLLRASLQILSVPYP